MLTAHSAQLAAAKSQWEGHSTLWRIIMLGLVPHLPKIQYRKFPREAHTHMNGNIIITLFEKSIF